MYSKLFHVCLLLKVSVLLSFVKKNKKFRGTFYTVGVIDTYTSHLIFTIKWFGTRWCIVIYRTK